jgi:hypothetical protein
VCTEGEQIERCVNTALFVLRVNRWSDAMIRTVLKVNRWTDVMIRLCVY